MALPTVMAHAFTRWTRSRGQGLQRSEPVSRVAGLSALVVSTLQAWPWPRLLVHLTRRHNQSGYPSAMHQVSRIEGQGLQRRQRLSGCTCRARLVCVAPPPICWPAQPTLPGSFLHQVRRINGEGLARCKCLTLRAQPCAKWTTSRGKACSAVGASAAAHAGRGWCGWRFALPAGMRCPR